jgi:hypothetical protein
MQVHLQRQQQRLEEMTKQTSVDGQPQQKH